MALPRVSTRGQETGRGQDRLVSWDRTLGIAQRWGPKPQPARAVNFKKGA